MKNRFLEFTAVGLLLLFHFYLVFTASERKSPVFDESIDITGGYSYWQENDYRINPENGSFLQRWIAAPLMFQKLKFPELKQIPLIQLSPFEISADFIFQVRQQSGKDTDVFKDDDNNPKPDNSSGRLFIFKKNIWNGRGAAFPYALRSLS